MPDWRRVGTGALELSLASPATGPMEAVWFSSDGSTLYARTRDGRVLETSDFETWRPSAVRGKSETPAETLSVQRLPAPGARLAAFPHAPGRLYALGAHLYQSGNGGRTWQNLTSFGNDSVIGPGQNDLAVSPRDPDQLVVANDFGVWRSLDGGASWAGLNQSLPNLIARRILATPAGPAPARLMADGVGTVELLHSTAAGGRNWQMAADPAAEQEIVARRRYSAVLEAGITALARAGDAIYAGAVDGRIWVSFDGGISWVPSAHRGTGRVERIFTDPDRPATAVAVLGGSGIHVLRTTNGGNFWDDLTANLPDEPATGVTADRADGVIYTAMRSGVYMLRADLTNPSTAAAAWTRIAGLPAAPVLDVKLSDSGDQLYASVAGYGFYAAAAPHRARILRIVNAADFSSRPAAPGSLVSVLGGRVNTVRGGNLNFPVLAASETASQVQVPFETTGTAVALALEAISANGARRVNLMLPLRPVSPAIFVSTDGQPMILDADSGVMLDARQGARSNTRVQVLATGLGKVQPDWPTGLAAPLMNPPAVAASVRAYLDRVPVEVTRAVLAPGYIGFYLVEMQLPAIVNSGPAELYLEAGGQESNRVRVYLEP